MKRAALLWRIVGFLLIILGIIGILAIQNWLSGISITMPEEALTYILPFAGYICCAIVVLIGIITLGGWFWNRHPKTIYTLSLIIGLVSIIGCYLTHNDNAFKVAISMLSMSIIIITILTMLLETFSARNINKHWRIAITLSFMTVYLIPMVGFVFPQCFDAVALSFPDPVLRQAVRNEVGTPFGFRTQTDLKRISHLSAGDWGDQSSITQLNGLEKCTGLEELQLNVDYELVDISPLSNLTNLKRLQITHFFQLNDITPLSNLRQLTYLCLDFNGITDISPLSNLTNLSVLVLSNEGITDISPISNLVNLSVLELSGSGIKDISPLAGLTNLTELNIGGNQITDISALSSLSKLTYLKLGGNPISDITALSHLNELNVIFMASSISDISPLLNNSGIGVGDDIYLNSEQLDDYSSTTMVPELTSRGVYFYYEGWGLDPNILNAATYHIQNAVTDYMTYHNMSIPTLSGLYTNADCSNCYVVNISALLIVNGGMLHETPDGCYLSNSTGMDNCNNNQSLGCEPANHYVWIVDDSGTVYSYCTGAGCKTNNSGYQNVWP